MYHFVLTLETGFLKRACLQGIHDAQTPSELYFLRCTCISEVYKNSLYIMYFDTCKLPTNIKQSRG